MTRPTPDNIEQILETAETLKFDGKYEEALILLERLIVLDPDNVTALEEVADNELSLGEFERAECAAKHVLALHRDSFTAYYILGFIASHREQWQESVRMLKIANGLEQNNAEILRCLGWSLFGAGAAIEGIVTLERALNLEPNNPLTLCDLGVVYVKMKEFAKARLLLLRAIDLEPENARAQECLEMVERMARQVTQ